MYRSYPAYMQDYQPSSNTYLRTHFEKQYTCQEQIKLNYFDSVFAAKKGHQKYRLQRNKIILQGLVPARQRYEYNHAIH